MPPVRHGERSEAIQGNTADACRAGLDRVGTTAVTRTRATHRPKTPCLLAAALLLAAAAPCGVMVIPPAIGMGPPGDVTSLNPLLGPSLYNAEATLLLYRPVIWPSGHATIDWDRSLAQSVDTTDNETFRVTLKPWKWSDGAPVTADDALFTWERIAKLGPIFNNAGAGGIPDRVREFRVLDAHRFEIELVAPVNPDWFELSGLSLIVPLPRHAWGDIGRDDMWRRQTDVSLYRVVDGPFQVAALKLDRYLTLIPNPLYGGHRSTLRRLVLDFLEGTDPLHALWAGEVDMAHIPFALYDRVRGRPGFVTQTLPEQFGTGGLTPNMRNPPCGFLRDVRVRQAMEDAADQRTMVDLVFRGFSHPAYGPIPLNLPGELSPAARAGKFPTGYDPARAARLLQEAGWQPGPDGVRVQGGQRLRFTTLIPDGSPDSVGEMTILQQNLRAVGIEMRVKTVTFGALTATIYGPPDGWDAMLLVQSYVGTPSGAGLFDTGGANNAGFYSDPVMDKRIAASVDQPGHEGMYAYQDYASQQLPMLFLPIGDFVLMAAADVRGVEDFVNPAGYWSPEYLSFSGARECHAAHDR